MPSWASLWFTHNPQLGRAFVLISYDANKSYFSHTCILIFPSFWDCYSFGCASIILCPCRLSLVIGAGCVRVMVSSMLGFIDMVLWKWPPTLCGRIFGLQRRPHLSLAVPKWLITFIVAITSFAMTSMGFWGLLFCAQKLMVVVGTLFWQLLYWYVFLVYSPYGCCGQWVTIYLEALTLLQFNSIL